MLISSEQLIEAMNDGFLMIDHTWRVTHSNRRAQVMLRMLDSDLHNYTLWDLLPDDPTTPTRREIERAQQQQISVEFDVFYPKLYVWHEVQAVPTEHGIALILRDITDRQWLLRREAERAYMRNLFDDAPVALSITRGIDHQFEFVNRFTYQIVGGRVMEGRTYRDVFPELASQGFIAILDHVYRSGLPYHANDQLVTFDRHSNGVMEDAYFTFTYQPLRGFDNQVSGILSLAVEVTTQVQARLNSAHQVATQQAILHQLPDGVIVTDAAGRIIYVNDAAAILHGVATLDVAPEDYAQTYHLFTLMDEPYPTADLPLARAVRDHVVVEKAAWKIRHPDGTVITVEGTARPITLDGTSIGAVLTLWRKDTAHDGQ